LLYVGLVPQHGIVQALQLDDAFGGGAARHCPLVFGLPVKNIAQEYGFRIVLHGNLWSACG
jgi:hypothetical protein